MTMWKPLSKTVEIAAAAGVAVLLVGCGQDAPEELTAAPVTVRTAPVAQAGAESGTELYGRVMPSRSATIGSRVSGPVVAISVAAGDVVRQGELMVTVQPDTSASDLGRAQAGLRAAEASVETAERNLRRFERLVERSAATEVELDRAQLDYDRAAAAVEEARSAVRAASAVAAEAEVRAPFAARVVERLVDVGDMIAPGRPLVRLEAVDGREAWLSVREQDVGLVKPGTAVPITIDSRPDLGVLHGVVSEVEPSADPVSHTFIARVDLGAVPVHTGVAAKGALPGEQTTIAVPAELVRSRGTLELVWVVEGGRLENRAVRTGRQLDGGLVEVLSGLQGDETLVLASEGTLQAGAPVEVRS